MNGMLNEFRKNNGNIELWLEPGRFLVATAGVLLSEVTQIKEKDDIVYVGVNTGFNSLIRPVLYSSYHVRKKEKQKHKHKYKNTKHKHKHKT